jgi:hypothetical protein
MIFVSLQKFECLPGSSLFRAQTKAVEEKEKKFGDEMRM